MMRMFVTNTSALFDQKITFRDMSDGQIKEIPVSVVAKQKNNSGFSSIKHKNTKRVVTVYSALSPGFTDAGAIVAQIQEEMKKWRAKPRPPKVPCLPL